MPWKIRRRWHLSGSDFAALISLGGDIMQRQPSGSCNLERSHSFLRLRRSSHLRCAICHAARISQTVSCANYL